MNRLLRRAATLVAATTACAAFFPAVASYAGPPVMNMSPCDNLDTAGNPVQIVPFTSIPIGTLLGVPLGSIDILVQSGQDSFVRYDSAPTVLDPTGTLLDVLVGVDLGTVSLADTFAACVVLPGTNGVWVSFNPVNLAIQACLTFGQPYNNVFCTPPI